MALIKAQAYRTSGGQLVEGAEAAAEAESQEMLVAICRGLESAGAWPQGTISPEGLAALIAANRKAFTAAQTGMPTHQWEAYVNSIPASETKIIDSIEGYIAARGGFPIIRDGLLLGAIGVSGATQEIDGDVAETAIAALG